MRKRKEDPTRCPYAGRPQTPYPLESTAVDRRSFLQSTALGTGAAVLGTYHPERAHAVPNAAGPSAGALPDWVPSQAGVLQSVATTNTFGSQNGRLPGWEHAFGTLVDDYSGGVFNPYWGPLGAMVLHGGGHAATFDNSVVLLDFNDLTFKRVSHPTPSASGANWAALAPGGPNSDPAFHTEYCEYGDGQPGAGHTYDTLAILAPEDGGAPCGSLVRVSSYAVHVNLSRNSGWAHRFDFASTTLRDGQWTRWSVNGPADYLFPGACSAFDSQRKRIWWMAGLSSNPPMLRYLDVASRQHQAIRYADHAPLAPPASPDSMTLRYEAQRDLLVLSCTVGSQWVWAYLRCAAPEQGWVIPALSHGIAAVPGAAHPFDYVAQADKFVLLSAADRLALYDIEPPRDPARTWAVTRRPLANGPIATAHVAGKRWSYAPALQSFVWMASSTSGVVAYRPFGV